MPSWWDSLFGDVPMPSGPPSRPPSRGATFGANYQALPDAQTVEDRRPEGTDYTVGMRRAPGAWTENYWPSDIRGGFDPFGSGQFPRGYDSLVASPLIANRGLRANTPGAYAPSFQQNYRAPRQRSFSPNLPSPSSSSGSDLPYIGAHLPWSPGDPGWTPPPPSSQQGSSGPVGLTLNSNPWGF
jgi:hypothetical protein